MTEQPTAERKIAIVGMAPASLPELKELPRPEWEVWGLNTLFNIIGDEWDRWYECHDLDWLKTRPGLNPTTDKQKYWEWLATDHGDRPVFMFAPDERVKNAVQYPLREVVSMFGRWLPDGRPEIYVQSTVDWMILAALLEFVNDANEKQEPVRGTLGIYGVDMAMGQEYAAQRPSCEHWLGIARGMGLTVYVPQTCDLMKAPYVYGLNSYDAVAKKMAARRQELEQQLSQVSQAEAQARDRKMAVRGALDDLNWVEQQRY